jgi:hypothetical protein
MFEGKGARKKLLGRRVEAVTQADYLESRVRPHLPAEPDATGKWTTRVIQLDDTGAATLEIAFNGLRIFAKLYPDDSGPRIYEKLKALRADGFGPGARYQVVEPIAFLPEHGMLLARAAEGLPVSAHIGVDDGALVVGAREAARWLAELHRSPLRIGRPQPLLESGELLSLAKRLSKAISQCPQHLDQALEMIDALQGLAADAVETLHVQSHGQYRPIHVFVADRAVTVIDLDRSRPCDPARDVAEFLHRLRMTTFWGTGSVERAEAATAVFLGRSRAPPRTTGHWIRSSVSIGPNSSARSRSGGHDRVRALGDRAGRRAGPSTARPHPAHSRRRASQAVRDPGRVAVAPPPNAGPSGDGDPRGTDRGRHAREPCPVHRGGVQRCACPASTGPAPGSRHGRRYPAPCPLDSGA